MTIIDGDWLVEKIEVSPVLYGGEEVTLHRKINKELFISYSMMVVKDFFDARSIAVVGASRDSGKVGNVIFRNALRSGLKVYPVNDKSREVMGQRAFKDLLEIPHEVDLVVISVPAKAVSLVLRQMQKKKIMLAIIISSGFSEGGNDILEKRILRIAEESGIKILGPNCFGLIDVDRKLNLTYFEGEVKKGDIAFISQSGAIGSVVLDRGIGLSGFVSLGDSSQIDFSELINYYSKDKNTKAIAIYMESLHVGRGEDFIRACKSCKKPIVILKAGKSKGGAHAAKTHTASLASEKGVYSGIFEQVGTIEVNSISQLFDVARIKSKYGEIGKNAIVVTNAGGLGVLVADYCDEEKINLLKISEGTLKHLDLVLSRNWSRRNPVDLAGDALAKDYMVAIGSLSKEKFDFFIVLLTSQHMSEVMKTAKVISKIRKPVFVCFAGGEKGLEAKNFFDKEGIINFEDPKEMCEAIGKAIL